MTDHATRLLILPALVKRLDLNTLRAELAYQKAAARQADANGFPATGDIHRDSYAIIKRELIERGVS